MFALHKKSNNSKLFLTFHASCLIHDESGGTEETHSRVCGVKGEGVRDEYSLEKSGNLQTTSRVRG